MENAYNDIISKYRKMRNNEKAFMFFRDGAFAAKKVCQEMDEKQIIFVRSVESVCSEEAFKEEKAKWADNIKSYNDALTEFKKNHPEWFTVNTVFKTLKTPIDIAEDVFRMSCSLRDTATLVEVYNVWQELEKRAKDLKDLLSQSEEYLDSKMQVKPDFKEAYDVEVQKLKDLYSFMTDSEIRALVPADTEMTKYTKRRKFNFEDLQ